QGLRPGPKVRRGVGRGDRVYLHVQRVRGGGRVRPDGPATGRCGRGGASGPPVRRRPVHGVRAVRGVQWVVPGGGLLVPGDGQEHLTASESVSPKGDSMSILHTAGMKPAASTIELGRGADGVVIEVLDHPELVVKEMNHPFKLGRNRVALELRLLHAV